MRDKITLIQKRGDPMGKSVYSMVLSDEVVSLIDREAFKRGLSRSQMINEVLAEFVGYSTDERRINELIGNLNEILIGASRLRVVRRQQSAIDFLSALNYKYSPRVTYSVDLSPDGSFGELKIALRTTNPDLLEITGEFFNDFIEIERSFVKDAEYGIRDGKLIRKLDFKKAENGKDLADLISAYVNNLDKLFNEYVFDYQMGTAKENLFRNYSSVRDKMNI